MNKLLDNETLSAFTRRDPHAFRIVFENYYQGLYYFAWKMTGTKEQSEDIIIGIFTKLFERYHLFDTYANIKAFLYISTRNACLNYLQHAAWLNERQKEFAEKMQDDVELTYHTEIKSDLLEAIHLAIDKLPDQCRRIFKMLYLEEMKPAEIASLLNISVDNVYNQKKRALQILRLQLGNNYMTAMILISAAAIPVA